MYFFGGNGRKRPKTAVFVHFPDISDISDKKTRPWPKRMTEMTKMATKSPFSSHLLTFLSKTPVWRPKMPEIDRKVAQKCHFSVIRYLNIWTNGPGSGQSGQNGRNTTLGSDHLRRAIRPSYGKVLSSSRSFESECFWDRHVGTSGSAPAVSGRRPPLAAFGPPLWGHLRVFLMLSQKHHFLRPARG